MLAKKQTISSPHAQTMLSLVGNTLHFGAVLTCFTIWPDGYMKPSWLGFSFCKTRNQEAAELQAVLPYLPGLPPPGLGTSTASRPETGRGMCRGICC